MAESELRDGDPERAGLIARAAAGGPAPAICRATETAPPPFCSPAQYSVVIRLLGRLKSLIGGEIRLIR
jgi:hypothetical protein